MELIHVTETDKYRVRIFLTGERTPEEREKAFLESAKRYAKYIRDNHPELFEKICVD